MENFEKKGLQKCGEGREIYYQPKEQLKVQYIFEERHRSMKENCLWEGAKKSKKKTNNSAFSATHTYIKLTLVSCFLLFFLCTFPLQIMG